MDTTLLKTSFQGDTPSPGRWLAHFFLGWLRLGPCSKLTAGLCPCLQLVKPSFEQHFDIDFKPSKPHPNSPCLAHPHVEPPPMHPSTPSCASKAESSLALACPPSSLVLQVMRIVKDLADSGCSKLNGRTDREAPAPRPGGQSLPAGDPSTRRRCKATLFPEVVETHEAKKALHLARNPYFGWGWVGGHDNCTP